MDKFNDSKTSHPKTLSFVKTNEERHWVGDGFPVRSIFSYNDLAQEMSPFLLLDYAGPENFAPTQKRRGVGAHPHRGFETVTIVYHGEVEHRDSSGGGGKIGPGDVQWMTAASGIIHEEFHGSEYASKGGPFEMIQLWVNLPQKDKMAKAGYQNILDAQIPKVTLPLDAGTARIIAGNYETAQGPAHTFSPMNVWDLRVKKNHSVNLSLPQGHTTALFILNGNAQLADGKSLNEAELAVFSRDGQGVSFESKTDLTALLLSGEPFAEPVVGYGPFVMNTETEIKEALADFKSGNFLNRIK